MTSRYRDPLLATAAVILLFAVLFILTSVTGPQPFVAH